MERGGGRVEIPSQPLEYSSMNHEESEDMSFRVSQLELLVKGFVSKGYLEKSMYNLERDMEKSMYNLERDLEKSMEGSMKTLDLIHI